MILPSHPVDVYVDGVLMQKNIAERFEFVTPQLQNGAFQYRVVIRDSRNSSKSGTTEVRNIQAGKFINVDLRESIG